MSVSFNFYKVIFLTVIVGLLFFPLPANNLWWREAVNSSHTLLFLFLSFIIYFLIHSKSRFSNGLIISLWTLFIAMLLGVMIELVQIFGPRDASLNDIYRNFVGVMAGLFLIAAFKLKQIPGQIFAMIFFIIPAIGFLWAGLNPVLQLSWHYIERYKNFPVIVDIGANWSSSFVSYNNSSLVKLSDVNQQNYQLRLIQFYAGSYPGISVIEPEPDWSSYSNLHLTIHSVNEHEYYMVLRVHDIQHNQEYTDRFNKKLLIKPGLNAFSISLNQIRFAVVGRELDLKNIAGLTLFVSRLKYPLQIAVTNIALK